MSLTLDEARALHAEICVLDLHADTAKLMDKLGYDLAARHERPMPRMANGFGHVDLPRLRDGGVAGQFFSFWTTPYPERGCARSVARQLDALDLAMAKHPAELARSRASSARSRRSRAAGCATWASCTSRRTRSAGRRRAAAPIRRRGSPGSGATR
jgi:membrane dipeptidase